MNGSEKLHSYRNVSVLAILTATKPPHLRLKTKSQRLELDGSMKVRVRANERSDSSREIAWAIISDSVQRCAVSECESQLKAP